MVFFSSNQSGRIFKHSLSILGSAALSAALLAGCSSPGSATEPKSAAAPAQNQAKTVKVTPLTKQSIGDPIEQVADVTASSKFDIVVKADGDVVEVLKKRGDSVEKGEVLFRVDSADAVSGSKKNRITVDSLQAQLSKAKQDTANAIREQQNTVNKLKKQVADLEINYNNMRNNYDLGDVLQNQVDQAETQLKNANMDLQSAEERLAVLSSTDATAALAAQLASAELSVQDAERNLAHYEVKAPANGALTDFDVRVGMTVSRGSRLGQLQQIDPITIEAALTNSAAKLVRGKKELNFHLSGTTEKRTASISYLADVMSTQNKAYTLQLTVDNADRKLSPGMKVQLELQGKSDQMVLAIPTLSVVREGSDNFVFILNDGQAEKRKVTLGRLNATIQEVLDGVKEGEKLVTSGQNQLQDKEKAELAN